MSPEITMAGAITALVAEKRAVGYKYAVDLTRSDGHALYVVQVDLDPSPSLAELGSRRLQGDPVG